MKGFHFVLFCFRKSSLDQSDSTQNMLRVLSKFLTLRAPRKFLNKLRACSGYVIHHLHGVNPLAPPLVRTPMGGLNSKMGKKSFRRSREGSILVRRRMTFLCEQVTNGVTSFGVLLSQRRSQRRPKQKRDPNSTECVHESQK